MIIIVCICSGFLFSELVMFGSVVLRMVLLRVCMKKVMVIS